MAGENTEYEKFVRSIVETLLRAQGLETVKVEHDVQVQGLARSHQIDVYWEYRLGGVTHRVIINCKRYAGTVEVTDVNTLAGVLMDLPRVQGIIVTTVGFQKGAIDVAKTHNIGLKIIRPPEDDDWQNRIREVHMELHIDTPELTGLQIALNEAWIKANFPDPNSQVGTFAADARTTRVRDLKTGTVANMNDLWNRAMRENPTKAGQAGRGVLRWEDARLERDEHPPLKVDSMEFRWTIREGEGMLHKLRHEPMAIVRDALSNTLLFVDPDGTITGDTEEELGRKPT